MKAKLIKVETKEYKGWLEEKYPDHFAQMSVDLTLKVRSAVKDVARALMGEVPYEIETMTKRFKQPPQGIEDINFVLGYNTDEGHVPGSLEEGGHDHSDPVLREYVEKYPDQWEIVKKSLALAKGTGRHACGFLISNVPVNEFVPTTTVSGVRVTAFTPNSVEGVGGLKMDFLVLNSLKDIQSAIKLIHSRKGMSDTTQLNGQYVPLFRQIPLPGEGFADIWDLPNDQEVFDEIVKGRTMTVFQFATEGAVKWLAYFDGTRKDGTRIVRSVEDLAIFTALDRPGPLNYYVTDPEYPETQHNALVEYVRRLKGEPRTEDIPKVMDMLAPETQGLLCFQESVEKTYKNLTGCTGAEAEEFRGNVAKKRKAKIEKAYSFFMEKATEKIGRENANAVWQSIMTFSDYGFCKAHSAGYAVIAYACAYLKYHYPLEWWCGVLQNANKVDINTKFWIHISDIVNLPDIKNSSENWSIQGDKVQAPLSLLEGLGETAHAQLTRYYPYSSIEDFAEKILLHQKTNSTESQETKVNKKTGESVTKPKITWGRSAITRRTVKALLVSGAMDSILPHDTTLSGALDLYNEALKDAHKRYNKSYTKPKDEEPIPLDPLSRYQLKKSVLPAWGLDLAPLMPYEVETPLKREEGKLVYEYIYYSPLEKRTVKDFLPIHGGLVVKKLNAVEPNGRNISAPVLAHIDDTRPFNYGPNKEKQAMELTIDVGAVKFNFVLWPNQDGRLETVPEVGDIVVALLEKWKPGDFAVKRIHIIKKALSKKKEAEDVETKEN
jgi:DNA polymerase III alpha subunit